MLFSNNETIFCLCFLFETIFGAVMAASIPTTTYMEYIVHLITNAK